MKPIYKLSLFILISTFLMITFSCKEAEIEFVDASNPSVQLEKNEISAISGESFTISVTAKVNDEGTLTYQWYRNDENSNSTGTRLAGETESTFTTSYNLKNGELEKIFYYYVVVTNTNNNVNGQKKASATSNLVKVTIIKDDSSGSDGNTDTGDENQGDGNTGTGDENQGDGNTDTGDENQGDGNTSTGGENQGDGNTDTGDDNQGDDNTSTGDDNQGDGNTDTGDGNQGDGNTDIGDGNQGDGNTDTGDDNDTETKPDYEISEKSGVMLQGFNWGSAPRTASSHWGKWYNVMLNNADTIGDKFSYVWCPPPSKCDTASSEGYCPTELNVLDNCYGTANELKQMIQAISPAKAIADIVVNHRSGSTSWGDFTNPTWGVEKGSNYAAICSDDEGFTGEPSLMGKATKRGASDTGEGYEASRDIDHTNTTVQQGIVDWMNNVLKPAGFVGWRYDYVKGFNGKYVGQYNAGSNAEFSVGEYWPTAGYNASSPSDWGNQIKNWISATASNGGQKSKAFDFALKGAMNSIFGCTWFDANWKGGSSGASNNYGLLADSSNLVISQPADAVTFVENHDTGSTQNHWALNTNAVGIAYAFILTHPGYPCVAWQHYFTYAESGSYDSEYYSKIKASTTYIANNTVPGTSNTYREHIDYLIDLRNRVGIEYDDTVVTTGTTSSCYVGEIVGNNGTLLVKIGNVTAATGTGYAGNNPIYSGTNFAIWEKNVDGDATLGGNGSSGSGGSGGTVSLTATKDVGSGNAVYFTGAFDEAENWTKAVRGTWSDGNVWSVNVTGSSFEWKALIGSYDWGESVIISSQTGWQWESDPNNSYPSTTSSKLQ